MRKISSILALLLPLLAAVPASAQAPAPAYNATPAPDDDERTRYLRHALNPDRPAEIQNLRQVGMGTGFLVGSQALLTNNHVVKDCVRITAQIGGSGGELAVARLDATDADADLALLHLDKPAAAHALFEADFARIDPSALFVVGFPSLGLPVVEPVLVGAQALREDLSTQKQRLQFSADVRHGNSGSPLFDNYGAVVGIVTQAIDSPKVYSRTGILVTDVGIAVASHTMVDFLRKHAVDPPLGERPAPLSADQRLPESRKIVARLVCWR
jgi:S1-C subfamily serine protease